MRGHELRFVFLCTALLIAQAAMAGAASTYWFQTGVRGGSATYGNSGASALIQTVVPQNNTIGSFGFWVGETLSNGAFVQVGYVIPNATAEYPSGCVPNPRNNTPVCATHVSLTAGQPVWFWEFFPHNVTSGFFGGYGPDGVLGSNGTFNNYSFRSYGDTWYFYFNGNVIGSADMNASTSGGNPPIAVAEYADTSTNSTLMAPVGFKNLAFTTGGGYDLVPSGYSVLGYGTGSAESLKNRYGLKEVGNYADYFRAGSGLPLPTNGTRLWTIGYTLNIVSPYGLSSSSNYEAYTIVNLTAPTSMNISPGERVVLKGWRGVGGGAYTGNDTSHLLSIYDNITEYPVWQQEYYVNVYSPYGNLTPTSGSGWYDMGAKANYSVARNLTPLTYGSRAVFDGWSTGVKGLSGSVIVEGQEYVDANWVTQYLVNVSSRYGTTTGSGWYDAGSTAYISLNTTTVPLGEGGRIQFQGWSNGMQNPSGNVTVGGPLFMHALFNEQFAASFLATDTYGEPVSNVEYFVVSGSRINGSAYLNAGQQYALQYARIDGLNISINQTFNVSSPRTITVKLPLYNVTINAKDLLGGPANATLSAEFSNGSTYTQFLGPNGSVTFHNVPYGLVYGSVGYEGASKSFNVSYGTGFAANFQALPPSLIIGIIAVAIIAVMLVVTLVLRRRGHHEARQPRSSTA